MATKQKEEVIIGRERGLHATQEPIDAYLMNAQFGDSIKVDLELAAAQMAICLATEPEEAPDDIGQRIDQITVESFVASDLLDEREVAFLSAAKTVVGLTYGASLQWRGSTT